jgi:Fe-coproporphyrin III synthase
MEPLKTLVVHPSLKCNLACKHCYSSSSPEHSASLDGNALKEFLSQARDEGYNYLAFSGGEPLLYKYLPDVLSFSKKLGYTNAITTNGMLLKSSLALRALGNIDLVNISIDGDADLHNRIRGQANAFDKMMEGVSFLKDNKRVFGFSHTVCHQNLEVLDYLENLTLYSHAELLQINKLSNFGRALDMDTALDLDKEHTFYKALFEKYQTIYRRNIEHFYTAITLTDRDNCLKHLAEDWQSLENQETQNNSLSQCFNTLAIDEDGNVVPYGYNVSKKWAFHNVLNAQSLRQSFVDSKTPLLYQTKELVYQSMAYLYQNTNMPFANATNLIEYISCN